ncbi:hypothetical protein GIB67_040902 [Kingdonia uniflora]|uniref:Uncharacterized protein n=1 Tax=Kingdonia uniflora TaxID=39325 RepID=A0A7J7L891_9MAGN|nr:hypothetical protein GIB67_040902 [Kingdonia uniflora]
MTQQQWDMLPVKIINPNDDWFLQLEPIDVSIKRIKESEEWGYDDSFSSNDESTSPIEEEFVIEAESCDVEEIWVQPKANGPTTATTDQPRGFHLKTTLKYNQQGLSTPTFVPTVVGTTTYHLGEPTPAIRVEYMLHERQPSPEERRMAGSAIKANGVGRLSLASGSDNDDGGRIVCLSLVNIRKVLSVEYSLRASATAR